MSIYHVSYESHLREITHEKFSARMWSPESYPHKILEREFSDKLNTESIYRVCFWSTYDDAVYSSINHFVLRKNVILRFEHEDLIAVGFNDSQDDGFDNKIVHLFWVKEKNRDKNFSNIGVPFDKISIQIDGEWESFSDYMAKVKGGNCRRFPGEEDKENTKVQAKIITKKKQWWHFGNFT